MGVVLYVVGFLLVFYSGEWFLVWLGLEVNMLGFIVLCMDIGSRVVSESLFKYYFVQVVASGMFLMLVLLGWYLLVSVVLMLKMGMGPFFYWFVVVVSGLSWGGCLLLMTVQKVLPLYLLSVVGVNILVLAGIMSVVVGSFGSFGVKDIKILFGFSSVNHMGWMILVQWYEVVYSWLYLLVYSVMIIVSLCYLKKGGNMFLFNDYKGMSMIVIVLSLGGIPPLLGFFLKWYGFVLVLGVDMWVSFLLLSASVVMLYVYLRLVFDMVLSGKFVVSWCMGVVERWMLVEVVHVVGGCLVMVCLLF